MHPLESKRSMQIALGAIVIVCAFWQAGHLGTHLHDDSFISLRYARSLASGMGLVFNPGEQVEGYTNFLWTLLLAMVMRLGIDAVALAGVLSAIAFAMLVVRLARFGCAHAPHPWWALPAPLLLALHPLARAESVGGLETSLFALLVWCGFEAAVDSNRRRGTVGAAFGLATLVRPEAIGLFAVVLALRWSRHGWRSIGHDVTVFGALVLPHFGFRFAYYGDIVPNTFHAKVAWSVGQAWRGARYAWDSGGAILSLPVLGLAIAGCGCGWRAVAGILALTYIGFVIAVGGDYAPTGRFMLPALPLVLMLVQAALWRVRAALGDHRRGREALPLLLLALVATQLVLEGNARLRARGWETMYPHDLEARRLLGETLRAQFDADTRVAVGSIGAIGYYARLPILDTFGLTDAEIGRMQVPWMGQASAGHEKGDADVVFRRAPEVIVFDRGFIAPRALRWEEFVLRARSPTEQLLVQDPRLRQRYRLRILPAGERFLHVLERIDG